MTPSAKQAARSIAVLVAELGLLFAAGLLAIALVGNDESDRAEESSARPVASQPAR